MTVWHATIGGWRKSSSRTVKHPSALPGVEVPGKASWRSFRRDWKDDDLMEVCEALGHLTQVGAGQAAGENCEVPCIPRVSYGREHRVRSDPAGLALLMVSVICVPKSAASCPSRQSLIPSHCRGRASGIFKGRQLEGRACSSMWAGMRRAHTLLSPKAQHFTHLRLSAEAGL